MTTAAETLPQGADKSLGSSRARISIWSWFMLLAGALFWASVGRPLRDPDIWWHVRTGRLILDEGIPHTEPWAFTALGNAWVPTAWLSDVTLAAVHSALGWWGVVSLKLILSAALLLLLGLELRRCGPPRVAAAVFPLTLVVLAPFLAERPQVVSLILSVWLAGVVRELLTSGRLPWHILAVSYLWANLHGMWVLVPVALALGGIGIILDHASDWKRVSLRAFSMAALSTAFAALTPVGPKLAYWPLVVRQAASDISEWQPTRFTSYQGMALLGIFLFWAAATARATTRTNRSEILWMGALLVFATQAGRNLAPASVLMAPFAVLAGTRVWGEQLARRPEPTLPRVLLPITVTTAVLSAITFAASQGPVDPAMPRQIADALRNEPGRVRVLNSYNVGGYLTGTGAPEVSVAIDGRTDNFDPDFVHRYVVETSGGLSTAQDLIDELDPDFAVLGKGSVLASDLVDAGWRRRVTDGDYVLLEPPRTRSAP